MPTGGSSEELADALIFAVRHVETSNRTNRDAVAVAGRRGHSDRQNDRRPGQYGRRSGGTALAKRLLCVPATQSAGPSQR